MNKPRFPPVDPSEIPPPIEGLDYTVEWQTPAPERQPLEGPSPMSETYEEAREPYCQACRALAGAPGVGPLKDALCELCARLGVVAAAVKRLDEKMDRLLPPAPKPRKRRRV